MHQRELALRAWKEAGVKEPASNYLRRLDTDDEACWETYITLLRNEDPKVLRELAMPLWETGDKVLRTNLVRTLDWDRPAERRLLQQCLRSCDGATDEPELLAASEKGPEAAAYVWKRGQTLGTDVAAIVEARRKART